MKRDKQFVLDSIKMDLFRVVTATGDLNKEIPQKSVLTFMEHAHEDFNKIELTEREKEIRDKLNKPKEKFHSLKGPNERLRWTEDVMTIRCLL
jgi:hypothetical protein